jgi:hypothetical protein
MLSLSPLERLETLQQTVQSILRLRGEQKDNTVLAVLRRTFEEKSKRQR